MGVWMVETVQNKQNIEKISEKTFLTGILLQITNS